MSGRGGKDLSSRSSRKSARKAAANEELQPRGIPLLYQLLALIMMFFVIAGVVVINDDEPQHPHHQQSGGAAGRAASLENYPIHLPRNNVMYQVFTRYGIEIPTTRNELQRAYRVASLRVHPDRPSGDTNLYQEFSDAYDRFLHEGSFFGLKDRKHKYDLLYYVTTNKLDMDMLKQMVHRMLKVLPHEHKEKMVKHASNITNTNKVVDVFNKLTDKQQEQVISLLDKVHKNKVRRVSKRRV